MEKLSLKDYFKHIKDIIYTSAFPSPTGKHLREERGPRVSNLPQKRAFWASRGTQGQKPWRREFGSLRGAQSWTGRHSERADTLKLLKYTHTNSDIFTDTNYQKSIKHTTPHTSARRCRHFILGAKTPLPDLTPGTRHSAPARLIDILPPEENTPVPGLSRRPQGGENGGEKKEKFPHSSQFLLRQSEWGCSPIFLRRLQGLFCCRSCILPPPQGLAAGAAIL